MDLFLHFLSRILGADHPLVARLSEIESTPDEDIASALEGVDEEQAPFIAAFFDLSDGDLAEIDSTLREAAQDENVSTADLADIATFTDYLSGVAQVRIEAAEAEAVERDALREKLTPQASDAGNGDGDDGDEPPTGGSDEENSGDDEPAPEENSEREPEPVTASQRPTVQRLQARRDPDIARRGEAAARQAEADQADHVVLAIGGRMPGKGTLNPGDELSFEEFGDFFAANASRWDRGNYGKTVLATAHSELPEERTLRGDDDDAEKVDGWIRNAKAAARAGGVGALTASGGLCAPLAPYYPMMSLGDDGRPVANFLPRFAAARGGISSIAPPSLLTTSTSGVGVWDADTDAAPAGATKGCLTVTCGSARTARIEAIYACLRLGNIGDMTYPERTAAWRNLIGVQHARVAETELLTSGTDVSIASVSTNTTDNSLLGVARELLPSVARAAVGFRSRHRMAPNEVLDVLLPFWVIDAIQNDLARQMPGVDTQAEQFAVAEATINSFFAARNVRIGLFRDTQQMQAQAVAPLNEWPASVTYYIFPTGSFLFLDDGELDLGVVRDSTLNSTNDFQIFAETFEGLGWVGVEAVEVALTLCHSGASSGTEDVACLLS